MTTVFSGVIGYKKFQKESPKTIVHILEFDPSQFSPIITLGGGQSIGLESVFSMYQRTSSIAAINGGFYKTGLALGSSIGMLVLNKKIVNLAETNRGAIGWSINSKTTLIDQLNSLAQLYIGNYQIVLNGWNEQLKSKQTIIYTPLFNRSTLTPYGTKEYLLTPEKTIRYLGNTGNNEIPSNHYILSIANDCPDIPLIYQTKTYYLNTIISPVLQKEQRMLWQNMDFILQAGPVLVKNKKNVLNDLKEPTPLEIGPKIQRARTSIGIKDDGNWIVAVVEASANTQTQGMTLEELANFMISQKCKDALNLDGGGSSTLIYEGKKHFSPSSLPHPFEHKNVVYMPKEGDRPVGNGIIIRKKI